MKPTSSLLALGLSVGSTWAQRQVPPEFKPGVKWQIEIQTTVDPKAPLQPTDAVVWDLDLYHLGRTPEVVNTLRKSNPNTVLICYFNAGLAQESDCDYDSKWKNSSLLGNPYDIDDPGEFGDEFWVNIKNETAVAWMKDRIKLANDIGCDGVDPDNIDGFLNDEDGRNGTGWFLTESDYVTFITQLADYAHGLTTKRGYTLLIGQKNAPELVDRVGTTLDFAVLEDCKTLNDAESSPFCNDFQPYISQGKPVLSIEYPSSLGNPQTGECNARGVTDEQYTTSCDDTQGNSDFSTVLKIQGDVGELNGCTQYCGGGPGAGVVITVTDSGLDDRSCPANSV